MKTRHNSGKKANSQRPPKIDPKDFEAGVIGLGLMGTSIIACLIAAGHSVVGGLTARLLLSP